MAHMIGMSQQPGYAGPIAGAEQGSLTGSTQPNMWTQFFGPTKGPIETAPYGSYRRENFALPDAYRGGNMYLTNVIITLVTEQDLWPVKLALPWRLTESEMEIQWDQIIFDNTLLGQVPEEGVSRLVTQQISERRDHYIRYGLAFMLEHGFMKTERGRLCYRMNLQQIRNAVLETAYLGVLFAYLRCKRPSYLGGIRSGMQRLSARGLARALQQEVEQFAMVQKTEYGFDLLDALGKRALKLIGVTPNLWILPEGMKMYLNLVRKENFHPGFAGDGGDLHPVGSRKAGRAEDVAVDTAKDCVVVETKSFEMPNMSEPLDPMQRAATVGEYYTMFNHLRGNARPGEYRSVWRDIFVYNEDKDGFTRITLDHALRNCGRFDPSSGELVDMPPSLLTGGVGDVPPDMFLRRAQPGRDALWEPAQFMGDMHSQYLRDPGLNDWADSVVAKVLAATPSMARALRDGLDLCRRIDATDPRGAVQNTWATWLFLAHVVPKTGEYWSEEHDLPMPPTAEEVDPYIHNPAGGLGPDAVRPFWAVLAAGAPHYDHVVPMMDVASKTMRAMPIGYANYPGMCILAMEKYRTTYGEIHTTARAFVQAIDSLYSELTAHTHDSVFLNGAHAPDWFKARDGRSTFFSNILYVSHAPLWIRFLTNTVGGTESVMLPRTGAPSTSPAAVRGWHWNTVDPSKLTTDYAAVSGVLTHRSAPGRDYDYQKMITALTGMLGYVAPTPVSDLVDAPTVLTSIMTETKDRIMRGVDAADTSLVSAVADTIAEVTTFLSSGIFTTIHAAQFDHDRATLMHLKVAAAVRSLVHVVMSLPPGAGEAEGAATRAVLVLHRCCGAKTVKGFLAFMLHTWFIAREVVRAGNRTVQWNESTDAAVVSLRASVEASIRTGVIPSGVPIAAWATPAVAPARKIATDAELPGWMEHEGSAYADIEEDDFDAHLDLAHGAKHIMIPAGALTSGEGERMLRTKLTGSASLAAALRTIAATAARLAHDGAYAGSKDPAANMSWKDFIVAVDPNNPTPADPHSNTLHMQPPLMTTQPASIRRMDARAAARRAGTNANNYSQNAMFGARFGAMVPAADDAAAAKRRRLLDEGTYAYGSEADRMAAEDALDEDPWEEPGAGIHFSAAMHGRWAEVSRTETDPLRRAAKLVFMGQRVVMQTLSKIITSDDVFPFGFLLLRPYMTYSMASAILTVAGAGTGETLVGHADFQLADNVVQKMHIGNFTMYLKSIVYQPHHVWIADNIMACGYVGGNNCDFRSASGSAGSEPPQSPSDPSMFACLLPYDCQQDGSQFASWEQELPNPLDITGTYATGNPALATLSNSVQRRHYASSAYYSLKHNWENTDQATMDPESIGTNNRYNTLCFQGHQAMYNPATQRYDLVQECTGHRGNRIYAGCGKVWRGLAKLLEPVNYTSTHGGAPVRTLTTMSV